MGRAPGACWRHPGHVGRCARCYDKRLSHGGGIVSVGVAAFPPLWRPSWTLPRSRFSLRCGAFVRVPRAAFEVVGLPPDRQALFKSAGLAPPPGGAFSMIKETNGAAGRLGSGLAFWEKSASPLWQQA